MSSVSFLWVKSKCFNYWCSLFPDWEGYNCAGFYRCYQYVTLRDFYANQLFILLLILRVVCKIVKGHLVSYHQIKASWWTSMLLIMSLPRLGYRKQYWSLLAVLGAEPAALGPGETALPQCGARLENWCCSWSRPSPSARPSPVLDSTTLGC